MPSFVCFLLTWLAVDMWNGCNWLHLVNGVQLCMHVRSLCEEFLMYAPALQSLSRKMTLKPPPLTNRGACSQLPVDGFACSHKHDFIYQFRCKNRRIKGRETQRRWCTLGSPHCQPRLFEVTHNSVIGKLLHVHAWGCFWKLKERNKDDLGTRWKYRIITENN